MKQLKAFVPLRINDTFYTWLGKAAKATPAALLPKVGHLLSTDPTGGDWATLGLVPPIDDVNLVHDLDGAARLLMFRINERKLPGSVRDEELSKRIKALVEQSGLPITKHDYARLKDEVVDELLPKAFITRTLVPVLVYPDMLLICQTSQKKIDDVLRMLFELARVNATVKFEPDYFRYEMGIPTVLKALATDDRGFENMDNMHAGEAMKLKGEDKRAITVKDRDAAGYEVQALIESDEYEVVELRIGWAAHAADDPQVHFTLTERGYFKGILLGAVALRDISKEDKHATAWITAKTYRHLLTDVTEALGGLQELKEKKDAPDLDL